MSKELKKRIITSLILFFITIYSILIHKLVFIIALIVTLSVCFDEWGKINYKYFNPKREGGLKYFFVQIAGLIYLFIFLVASIALRGNDFENTIFFIVILCVCICSDIGGYIFGKTFGGKKLTRISPNKTISGSIGSFIFSTIPLFLFNFQNYFYTPLDLSVRNTILCLTISFVCQLGDILISYFKRLSKVKDTGTILPGHGGLLDRIDGIIFAIPTVYFLKILNIF